MRFGLAVLLLWQVLCFLQSCFMNSPNAHYVDQQQSNRAVKTIIICGEPVRQRARQYSAFWLIFDVLVQRVATIQIWGSN